MIAFLRLALILFVVLTLFYVVLSLYVRSLARERLERRWDAKPHRARDGVRRDDFIARGMKQYEKSAKPKLLLGVYILPLAAVGILIYLLNFS